MNKEKILTVLVIVSLVLSVFTLVLLLRVNGTNTITNIAEPTADSGTARADSFELEILFTYGGGVNQVSFVRENETELSMGLQEESDSGRNYTLISLDKTSFLNDFYAQMHAANPQGPVGVIRCQNTFYLDITANRYSSNITPTYRLGYCTP